MAVRRLRSASGKWQTLIFDDINQFTENHGRLENLEKFREARQKVVKKFKLPERVPIMHLLDVFMQDDLDIWTESPGLPWIHSGYTTKGCIKKDPDAVERVGWFWHQVKCGKKMVFPDCLANVRSHLDDDGNKEVSVVWDYPATITFGEAMFALPLLRAYRKHPIDYGKQFHGLDFNNFDKNVPAWLIDEAFIILTGNLDLSRYEGGGKREPLIPGEERAFQHMLDCICSYFIDTRIRMENGERYQKNSGVARASYFTQIVRDIIKALVLEYSFLIAGVSPDIAKIEKIMWTNFGLELIVN